MDTRRIFSILFTVSLVGLCSWADPISADPATSKLQAVLQSKYDNLNAAMARGDFTRYLSYHTADYSESDSQGGHPEYHGRNQDRDQTKKVMQWIKHFDAVNHVQFHLHDAVMNLRVAGDTVEVTADERSSIQPSLIESEHDIWVKQAGVWLIKQRRHSGYHVSPESTMPEKGKAISLTP